jgi:hypothetical protein
MRADATKVIVEQLGLLLDEVRALRAETTLMHWDEARLRSAFQIDGGGARARPRRVPPASTSTTSALTNAFSASAVPGPIAGAGLPGLVFACSGLIFLARRRQRKLL